MSRNLQPVEIDFYTVSKITRLIVEKYSEIINEL
jgi:hypothetical protein